MTGKRRSGLRANGEGSIYQLPDGRWRGSVFLGYRDGKPHRKYVTRRTRTEVAAEIRRLLEAERRGQLITTGSMTVGEWFAVYLDQVARPKIRPRWASLVVVWKMVNRPAMVRAPGSPTVTMMAKAGQSASVSNG